MRRALLLFLFLTVPALAADSPLVAEGRAALEKNDLEKAAAALEKAVGQNPKDAEAHFLLGQVYGIQAQKASMLSKAGWAKKTKAEFEKAVELDPNLIDARFALIDYYTMAPGFMGGSQEKALQQAAEIKKRDGIQGHRAYGRIYLRDKKQDLARKEYVDMVRENPNSAKAHYYLANFLLREKNYTGALHELDMTLKLDPAFMPVHITVGQHAAQSGTNYARGEESLRKYLAHKPGEQEPSHMPAWYWLGMVQEKQGKKAEARASYLSAQKLAPESKDVTEALKRVR
jgi:tetratricopeptide (TPR) repeat protein